MLDPFAPLIKNAELDNSTLRLSLLGAVGVTGLAGLLYQIRLLNEVKGLRAAKRQTRTYAKEMGVPAGIRTTTETGLQNAYYKPSEAYWLNNRLSQLMGVRPTREEQQGEKTGSLTFGSAFRKPAIIAHELGHANIGNRPWYSPSRLNQNYGRLLAAPASVIANFGSPLVGAAASQFAKNVPLPSPRWRAAAGLLAGGLSGAALGGVANLPTLINEWQASALARDTLAKDPTLTPRERDKSDKMLNRAFGSYLLGATLFPAIGGTIGAASEQL
jgi:hypothetical protein